MLLMLSVFRSQILIFLMPFMCYVGLHVIGLFANDVIIIGSACGDWPAYFNLTIGNPRADKLGRNCFECIGRRSFVNREICVRATFMHGAIENYSMLQLQSFQVDGPQNREISLFTGNTIGRFFTITFQGGKQSATSCDYGPISIRPAAFITYLLALFTLYFGIASE